MKYIHRCTWFFFELASRHFSFEYQFVNFISHPERSANITQKFNFNLVEYKMLSFKLKQDCFAYSSKGMNFRLFRANKPPPPKEASIWCFKFFIALALNLGFA